MGYKQTEERGKMERKRDERAKWGRRNREVRIVRKREGRSESNREMTGKQRAGGKGTVRKRA